MSIDPEVIHPLSPAGKNAVWIVPKWITYVAIGFGIILIIAILKTLLPIIIMGLLLGVIWRQART